MVFLVVFQLLRASPYGFVDGLLHALRDVVGIHDDLPVYVARCTSCRLCQTPVAAEEALLVGVEDGNERYFGQVQSLTEQVHPHQDVIDAGPEIVDDLDTVQARHVAVDIGRAYVVVQQVFRQLLRHPFGQRRDKHALFLLGTHDDLVHQVVYLVLRGAHVYLRIEQPRRTDKLFHHDPFRLLQLVVGRRGRHVDHLMDKAVELLEAQRTVVEGGREAEAVLHEVGLAGTVAAVHGGDLRYAHVALVDDHQVVLGEEVQ